jgi:transposase
LPLLEADQLIADKAYDADERVIDPLVAAGRTVVIPPKANRKTTRYYDTERFKARHLIENFFARLKQFRAIATRYDKTARNFLAAIHLAATVTWLN